MTPPIVLDMTERKAQQYILRYPDGTTWGFEGFLKSVDMVGGPLDLSINVELVVSRRGLIDPKKTQTPRYVTDDVKDCYLDDTRLDVCPFCGSPLPDMPLRPVMSDLFCARCGGPRRNRL